MSWLVESIVAVAFHEPAGDGTPDALQPWLRAFKSNPQNFQSSIPGQAASATAIGSVGELQAAVTAQLGRLELGLTSLTRNDDGLSHIGDLETALQVLRSYFLLMIEPLRHQRLAVVLNAAQRVGSQAEALERLRSEVRLGEDLPSSAIDIQFRFNIQRSLETGVTINRLATWGVGTQQIFVMQVTPGSVAPSATIKEHHATVLNIDVNTSPATPTTDADVGSLFEELISDARALVESGYAYLIR
ncbi:hypothetical protein G7077_01325 [Sphingomonas piscis]|uniref:Uncharacterized protein n=1 Tax=Sphingomonas piscis TaxID=2714943 RepID=A0A6G7YLY5_9SPHN|nr:hypothetical protein [Sphingomonas piscis]QIK77754.1 hypothetical protein G7077_01325 [Sphingomonas piscis]